MSNAEKIKKLQEEIDSLQAIDNAFNAMPSEQQLAVQLHTLLCHYNHTDGCSWDYENSGGRIDWKGHAHGRYLEKALLVQTFCNKVGIKANDAVELMKLMQVY